MTEPLSNNQTTLVSYKPVLISLVAISSITLLVVGVLGHLHVIKGMNSVTASCLLGCGMIPLGVLLVLALYSSAKKEVEYVPVRESLVEIPADNVTEKSSLYAGMVNEVLKKLNEAEITLSVEEIPDHLIVDVIKNTTPYAIKIPFKRGSSNYLEILSADRIVNIILARLFLGDIINLNLNHIDDTETVFNTTKEFLNGKGIKEDFTYLAKADQVRITFKRNPKDLVCVFPFSEASPSRIFGTILQNIKESPSAQKM